jgi:hypothetical protein
VDCPTDGATPDAPQVATSDDTPDDAPTAKPPLKPAPAGWRVFHEGNGMCTATAPDPCSHPGCNPPPPKDVACPPNMDRKKTGVVTPP